MVRILILVLSIAGINSVNGQYDRRIGIKSGVNISTFSDSPNSNSASKLGFHAGAFTRNSLTEKLTLRTEAYYSSQGQKNKYAGYNTATTIHSLNLPFLLEIGQAATFDFGGQLGLILGGREVGSAGTGINSDLSEILQTVEFGLVAGVSMHPGHFDMGLRYNIGLTNVFDFPDGSAYKGMTFANRVIHFYVGYVF